MSSYSLAQTIIFITSFIIMAAGLVGTVFPFIPGIILIWTGIFLYAGITQFQELTLSFLTMITILAFIAIFLDWLSGMWEAKTVRASIWVVVGAVAGGIIGSLVGLVSALIIGTFIGALIGEVLGGRKEIVKIELKTYTIIGFLAGAVVKVAVGVSMVGLFIYKVFI